MPSNKKLLQAAAGNAGESLYVEDVFSTYLYTGNGTGQTITNDIDLSGEGGLVWMKDRTTGNVSVGWNTLVDTERGGANQIWSNSTNGQVNLPSRALTFNSNGFSVSADIYHTNRSGDDFASFTFRKAEKFFDVVTYTGNKDTGGSQTISHNLGVAPAVIITKCLSTSAWAVYHASNSGESTPQKTLLKLNETAAYETDIDVWNNTAPTDSVFSVGNSTYTNIDGQQFVAYLFASDAGGFGDDDENIIKCGSYVGNGGSALNSINVGFEPQWVMVKNTSALGNWHMLDVMRGFSVAASGSGPFGGSPLYANLSNAEGSGTRTLNPTATGFEFSSGTAAFNNNGNTFIYIAIRRPMKTPASGTEVFGAIGGPQTNGFPTGVFSDASIVGARTGSDKYYGFTSRLTGTGYLNTTSTGAENSSAGFTWDRMTGFWEGSWTSDYFGWSFKRATNFFDVVAYTGDGAATQTLNHNLGVTPDIIVVKKRSTSGSQWPIIITSTTDTMYLNTTNASFGAFYYIDNPTSTTFDVQTDGSAPQSNQNGETYIAYLFATLAGVSKVGSVAHSGTTNVNCGFSAGARFVLVKRTDSSGDWYVWDSVRGIVAGNDPYLLLNSTAAEVTNTDYIDPLSSGFTLTSSFTAGTYIFLAIA